MKFLKPSANLHAFHCRILFLHIILKDGLDRAVSWPLAVVLQVRRDAYLPKKPNPQQPFFKSFWLNSADYFQKLSQQLSKYFVASLDVVDKVDAVISCNAFYLPEQTEVLMRISIFVSMSLVLISVTLLVILATIFQHLDMGVLKLFVNP